MLSQKWAHSEYDALCSLVKTLISSSKDTPIDLPALSFPGDPVNSEDSTAQDRTDAVDNNTATTRAISFGSKADIKEDTTTIDKDTCIINNDTASVDNDAAIFPFNNMAVMNNNTVNEDKDTATVSVISIDSMTTINNDTVKEDNDTATGGAISVCSMAIINNDTVAQGNDNTNGNNSESGTAAAKGDSGTCIDISINRMTVDLCGIATLNKIHYQYHQCPFG